MSSIKFVWPKPTTNQPKLAVTPLLIYPVNICMCFKTDTSQLCHPQNCLLDIPPVFVFSSVHNISKGNDFADLCAISGHHCQLTLLKHFFVSCSIHRLLHILINGVIRQIVTTSNLYLFSSFHRFVKMIETFILHIKIDWEKVN